LFADLHWNGRDLGLGVAATIPLLLAFACLLRSTLPALQRIRLFLETVMKPAMRHWNWLQLAWISILAGVCEEALFRAVLQGGLSEVVGPGSALVLAAVVFGLCHWITHTYALLAALVGLYLGGLWLWTGNLLVPIVAHAVYDFVALAWLLRGRRPAGDSG
jgi:membrane protease YdiL (CAAX protease family)